MNNVNRTMIRHPKALKAGTCFRGVLRVLLLMSLLALRHQGLAQNPAKPATVTLPSGIVLAREWQTSPGLDAKANAEIGRLLARLGTAGIGSEREKGLAIFQGVQWLMPYDDAVKALSLTQKPSSTGKLASSILPQGSFYFATFDGLFEGEFPHLVMVVDSARQVVCIQLENPAPKNQAEELHYTGDKAGNIYNFLSMGKKTLPASDVYQRSHYQYSDGIGTGWRRVYASSDVSPDAAKSRLYKLDSALVDPHGGPKKVGYSYGTSKTLKLMRWYIPAPLAQLILQYTAGKGAGGK